MELQNSSKPVPFWKKPERLFTVVALGALGAFAASKVIPILAGIVWAGVNLFIGLGVLGVLLLVLTNKRLWKSLFYLTDIFSKKVLGLVFELDPFVIADSRINKMRERRETFNEQALAVDKQKHLLNTKIEANTREAEKQHNRAEQAQKDGKTELAGVALRHKERLLEGLRKQIGLRDNLAAFSVKLKEIYRKIGYEIEDQENELNYIKSLFESLKEGANALATAKKIFQGDPSEILEYEQNLAWLNDRMAHNLASMEQDYSIVSEFTEKIDLDNAHYEVKALEKLDNSSLLKLKERAKEPVYVSNRKLGETEKNSGPVFGGSSHNLLND